MVTKVITCVEARPVFGLLWSEALGLWQPDSTPAKRTHCPVISQLHTTIMFPFKSLGLVLAAGVCTAAARQPLSNLHDACELAVDRSQYDLCPVFHDRGQDRVVRVRAELSPIIQAHYDISLGGALSTQNGEEVEPQVRTGNAIAPPEK
jgi:hypothetical protein